MKSNFGAIVFVIILLVVAFGLIAFAAEFVFGRPLPELIRDLLFLIQRK